MFKTNVLSSLKSILPTIHQPLPLNKRESQQLLNALTASFRKHLDREHGWAPDEPVVAAAAPSPSATPPNQPLTYLPVASPTTNPDNHRRPTDRHVRAVLSNPLFSYDPRRQEGYPRRPIPTWGPIEAFVAGAAKGMMTTTRASGILAAVRNEICQSPNISMSEGMRESGVGLLIVKWLRSSGMERDLSFLADHVLLRRLLRFMVAEGLDDVAWEWFGRVVDGSGPSEIRLSPAPAVLLNEIIRAKCCHAGSLDEAYAAILHAQEVLRTRPDAFSPSMNMAWRNLSWRSTVEAWKRPTPSEALFESYVDIDDYLNRPHPLDRAHLSLHHPTKPTVSPALSYLKELKDEADWKKRRSQSESQYLSSMDATRTGRAPPAAIRLMSMGLDTVKYFSLRDQQDEAQRVLELLRLKCGRLFTTPTESPWQHRIAAQVIFSP